jgi:hypothetical protein
MKPAFSGAGLIVMIFLGLSSTTGCDLFVSRGGEGQPCFSETSGCAGSLVCIQGTCRTAVTDGGDGGDIDLDGGDFAPDAGDLGDAGDDAGSGGDDSIDGGDGDGGNGGDDGGIVVHQIYRSVGYNNKNALATGDPISMTISDISATFSADLPLNVGVGDIIQYDTTGEGNVDSLAVIHGRNNGQSFVVANAAGGKANAADTVHWAVFRAYTSLSGALGMTENSGIDGSLRDFDADAFDPKDLVGHQRVLNIACYADAVDNGETVYLDNWITDENYFLRIFTPVDSSQVGVSQRHTGAWTAAAYTLGHVCAEYDELFTIGQHMVVRIDGLQIDKTGSGSQYCTAVMIENDAVVDLSNNIIRGTGTEGVGVFLSSKFALLRMWNNVVYDAAVNSGDGIHVGSNTQAFIYNNTIYNCFRGVYSEFNTSQAVVLKNNLAIGNSDYDFDADANFSTDSSNNCSSDDSAALAFEPDGITGASENDFKSAAGGDFHLKSDATCVNQGTNLDSDPNLPFSIDIDLQQRDDGPWDIGADEYFP